MCNSAFIKRLQIYTDQLVERKRVRLWSGGLMFKSWAGQIEHSVINGWLPLRHFFKRSCVACRFNDTKMGLVNLLTQSGEIRQEQYDEI